MRTVHASREQLPSARRSRGTHCPPHGLVRYLAGVERWWFQRNVERRDLLFLVTTADKPALDVEPPEDADFAADLEAWRTERAISRRILQAHALDHTARPLDRHKDVDLHWLILRMIIEYSQHCGHLDLLSEAIGGSVGA